MCRKNLPDNCITEEPVCKGVGIKFSLALVLLPFKNDLVRSVSAVNGRAKPMKSQLLSLIAPAAPLTVLNPPVTANLAVVRWGLMLSANSMK